MTQVTEAQVSAGQMAYGRLTLFLYDRLVLGASCSCLWGCKAKVMLSQYRELVSDNHLDVGVGSGYFLDNCQFPSDSPRIALMDLNDNSLEFTAKRISRYSPEVYRRNVLEDMSVSAGKFDSVAMNLLLHCLPGPLDYKGRIFDLCKGIMNDDAVLFGATIVGAGTSQSWFAKKMIHFYNRKGIFTNKDDSEESLRMELNKRFSNVSVRTNGCIAIFSAQNRINKDTYHY